jgi:glycosyltransferase involved in cell wall biosynthesis
MASVSGVLDGLPDPFGADRQELVARLDRVGRNELAASLRRYEDENLLLTPVLSVRQAYQGRPDLRAAFPDVFDSDAEGFASWLDAEAIRELGFPPSFAETFRVRARGRALARIFSYVNRTWWAMEAFPLAFVGVGHRALARSLFGLLRHGLEFDLDDVLFFVWTMDAKPWAGLPLALELAANIRRSPSTRLPEGQDALLRDLLRKSPEFGRALAEYRRRYSGPFFDEQHRLIEKCERGEDRPVHVFDVMRDRRARSSPGTLRPDGPAAATAPPSSDRIRSGSGVNLFGYHKSPIGLGMATEGLVSALRSQDVPVARNVVGNVAMVRDLKPDDFLQKFDHRFDTNLFVSYPHHHDSLLNGLPRWMVDGRTNVVFLAWEQRDGTHYWRDLYCEFDQVWALSRFAAESLERCLRRPVLPVPCVLDTSVLPPAATKPEVGLESDRFVFLYVFDANSSIERKNPEAVIRAFARAFTEKDAASLVLKVSNADRLEHRQRLRRLLAEARERLGCRVRVLTENLSRRGILQLLSAVDCYVSLHRAEGFGYTCAEAMAYGRPVVATRYSGNLDFMTDENSFLVDAREVLVDHPEGPFQRGSVWAEADISSAASILREVYRDHSAALRHGEQARRDVEALLAPKTVGRIVAKALVS